MGFLFLEALHFDARQSRLQRVAANTTYEGFYVIRLPLPSRGQGIAIKLGALFELIEIGSITRSSVDSLKGWTGQEPEKVEAMFDGMREIAPSILACNSEDAVLVIPPTMSEVAQHAEMVEIVFRPLRSRGAEVQRIGVVTAPSVAA